MHRFLAAFLVTSFAACAAETEPDPGYGVGLGTPENPVPKDDATYVTTSRVASKVGAVQVSLAVARLKAFALNPAKTILTLATESGAPELTKVYADLSSTLESQLEGWLNVEIDKLMVGGKPVRQFATEVAGFAETALTQFGLDSSLTFIPGRAMHRLTALTFRLAGLDVVVPIGGLAADTLMQQPSLTIGEAGALTFGDQKFGLAFGDHAWHGVNLATSRVFGADVRTALVQGLDCRAVAQTVAARCQLTSCVGHILELTALCNEAIDLLVSELGDQVADFEFDVLRYASGTARLADDTFDGLAERIVDGVWSTEMKLGSTPAMFTATSR